MTHPPDQQPSSPVTEPPSVLQGVLAAMLPSVLAAEGALLGIKDSATGRYVHVNAAMAAFLGSAADDVLGSSDTELFDPATAAALRAADHGALAQTEALVSEHHLERAGTRYSFKVLRLAPAADPVGQRWLCSVWNDLAKQHQQQAQLRTALEQIEQQQRANELLRRELADQALRDPASGLYSRAHFEDQLRREVDLSTREHREFALVYIEIDPASEDVRRLGPIGQAHVLEAMGRLLRGGTRAMDASCRFDERRFAVLLSGVGLATGHSRMEGLRRKCATQIVMHAGQELSFTVAMGVASFPHTAQTQQDLAAACEAALAEAQRRGGNHVTLAAIRFEAGP